MPTYVLDASSQTVVLPRGPVVVALRADGPARVDVMGEAGPHLRRPTPDLVVIPSLAGTTTLRVSPATGPVFPSPTTVGLTVEVRRPGEAEPDRIQVSPADVSGLPHRDVVLLTPRDGAILVSLVADTGVERLPDLVMRARAVTREMLGADRVDGDHAVAITVALDPSASARWTATPDGVGALLDVLVGMSRVVSLDEALPRVAVAGSRPEWIRQSHDVAGFGALVLDTLTARPAEVGFTSVVPGPPALPGGARRVHYVVTDAVPADLGRRTPGARSDPASTTHVVALTPDTAGADPAGGTRLTHSRTSPWGARLVQDGSDELRHVVRSLLVPCLDVDAQPRTEVDP